MRFVFVMDPMTRVLPDKDTTYAFMRAAQRRGHESLHCEPHELFVRDSDVFAKVRTVRVQDAPPHFNFSGEAETVRLADVEAVFLRKDPPFDAGYLYATLLLELARDRTVLVNDPRGVRDANEKLYALHFARHMPRSLVSSDRDAILAFMADVGGRAVVKPLDGAGGAGVLMVSEGDKNNKSILDMITGEGRRHAMVQEYLPAVVKGDKRILLLEGEILGAINRVPRSDDLRSNIHVGGVVQPVEVTATERAMVADMAPRLRAAGLVFVGLDLIGERLTEVNVTSPTGIQEMSRHHGIDLAEHVIAWAEARAQDLAPNLRSIPAR